MAAYFAALDPMTLVRALPGNVAQGIIWGIMALGVYITFRILDFADLTVDGSLATGGAVAVMLIRAGVNPALALIFAFLAGMAAGFVTGVLHTFFGIPGILASILTQIGLYSVNLGIMGKSNQAVNVMQYKLVASLRYVTGEGNWIFFLKLILAALDPGSHSATGSSEQNSEHPSVRQDVTNRWLVLRGINTGFNKVLALMISNGLVGLCGGIYAQYQGAADVNMGRGAIVIGLAAVIISEVIFGKFCAHRKAAFAFTLGAVFIGAILYYLVIALVLWLKMPSDYMKLFSAVVVACFLAVPYMKDTYFKKGRAK